MTTPALADALSGVSVALVARALGKACVIERVELRHSLATISARDIADALEDTVRAIPEAWWDKREADGAGFTDLLAVPMVDDLAELLSAHGALGHLAVLRAVCAGPLGRYYARTLDRIELQCGDPVPPCLRPTHKAIPGATPAPTTMRRGHLLAPTGFELYPGPPVNLPVSVALDFGRRLELDAATWIGDAGGGAFPLVGTVHPWASGEDLAVERAVQPTFFGVCPVDWDAAPILDQLAAAAAHRAGIAVLPELCLPSSDALLSGIQEDASRYPALVVSGSAHEAHDDERSNAVRVTLHGVELMLHRKVHPFSASYVGEPHGIFDPPLEEDLECARPRLTVAAGSFTRLGVVICADLNDTELPRALGDAGVNLLLVPALTPSAGAFMTSAGNLAGQNQAVTVIANGTPAIPPGEPACTAALVWAVVPRAAANNREEAYGVLKSDRRAVGILNLNVALAGAMTFLP